MPNQYSKPIRDALLALAVLAALGACGAQPAPGPQITQQQQAGPLTVKLEMPARTPVGAEQQVLVTLADEHGPVENAQVWLALVMPSMPMGPNEPDAQAEAGGRYRTTVLFTMPGSWNLDVHAVAGGQEYVAHFHAQTQ